MDLKAGAESGWDFTSRWYRDGDGDGSGTLRETRTSQILPTDLNALLCLNEKTLASFHRMLGGCVRQPSHLGTDSRPRTAPSSQTWRYATLTCRFLTGDGDSAAPYDQAAARRRGAMESVLWDAERGAWFDYDLMTHSKHLEFYPSNLAPIWAQCYSRPEMGERAVRYLKVGGHYRLLWGLNSRNKAGGIDLFLFVF